MRGKGGDGETRRMNRPLKWGLIVVVSLTALVVIAGFVVLRVTADQDRFTWTSRRLADWDSFDGRLFRTADLAWSRSASRRVFFGCLFPAMRFLFT
jgi:hypothetical protein